MPAERRPLDYAALHGVAARRGLHWAWWALIILAGGFVLSLGIVLAFG